MSPTSAGHRLKFCYFSPASDVEYIFEWNITEVDFSWCRTEYCISKYQGKHTDKPEKKL